MRTHTHHILYTRTQRTCPDTHAPTYGCLRKNEGGWGGRDSSNSGSAHSLSFAYHTACIGVELRLLLLLLPLTLSRRSYLVPPRWLPEKNNLEPALSHSQKFKKKTLLLFLLWPLTTFFLKKTSTVIFFFFKTFLVSDLKIILWIGTAWLLRWRVTSSSAWSGTTTAPPSSPSSTPSLRRSPSSTSHSARRVNSSGLTGSFFRHAHPTSR